MKVYSFENTLVAVNGVPISGWSDGDDVIDIKRLTDSASHKIGAGGTMTVSISSDRSGEITFKLQQTSDSNQYLQQLCTLQEGGALTFVPIAVLVQDVYRQDRSTGNVGYIKRPADYTRGTMSGDQEWTIVVEDLQTIMGTTPTVI